MNKLKISALSPTPLLVILAVCVLISVPVRMFQIVNLIEPETGFWVTKDFTVYLLYILLAVFGIISFFITAFAGRMPIPEFNNKKNIPLGVFSAILGVSLVLDSVTNITDFIKLLSSYVSTSGQNIYTYLTTSGAIPIGLAGFFGAFAVIYFIIFTICMFTGSSAFERQRILALNPILWAMFRLISNFVNPISFKNVSALFLELLMLMFVMIFFLSFARIASAINEEKSMWILWFAGTCAALLAFICSLSPFILVITGRGSFIPANYPLHFCDLGVALFITSFLFTVTPLTNDVEE